jgi:hypothetical protein
MTRRPGSVSLLAVLLVPLSLGLAAACGSGATKADGAAGAGDGAAGAGGGAAGAGGGAAGAGGSTAGAGGSAADAGGADARGTDAGSVCASAVVNGACTTTGTTCTSCPADVCSFCTALSCSGGGRWVYQESPPPPCFACGPTLKCQNGKQICQMQVGGAVGNPPVYRCSAIPAECLLTPTCACLMAPAGQCQESGPGQITITIPVP